MRKIYLSGGDLRSVAVYFRALTGVVSVVYGYANSALPAPSYQQVCSGKTGAVEAVALTYQPHILSLSAVFLHFFRLLEPILFQYQPHHQRHGIYSVFSEERDLARAAVTALQKRHLNPITIEIAALDNFFAAENAPLPTLEPPRQANEPFSAEERQLLYAFWQKPKLTELKKILSEEEFAITQEQSTEAPFSHCYDQLFAAGIYVDLLSGEPLFCSNDKYDAGCGWPSFSQPLTEETLTYHADFKGGQKRIEVRSAVSDNHLGHVFFDEPSPSGKRYCINGTSLRFIPWSKMDAAGYGDLKIKVKK